MNVELARKNMVENQVRTWEVLDARVLDVLGTVRREDFVPSRYRALAFADFAMPIGHGEVMFKPIVEGRILQALALALTEDVLEIGTGTGFLGACMARLAARVTSVELRADLADDARARLAHAGVENILVEPADAIATFQAPAPFDVVMVGGAVYSLPDRIREMVRPGGRLFAIVGESPVMQARLCTRVDATHWLEESLFETDVPYLQNATPPSRFVL